MRCEDWRILIDTYVDNSLDETLTVRMEKHLLSCAACSYEVHSLRQSVSLLKANVEYFETTPQYRERTLAALLSEHQKDVPSVPQDNNTQWTLPFNMEKEK